MKYKFQLISYALIFFVGYLSNFLLPVTFFVGEPLKVESAERARPLDKNTYSNVRVVDKMPDDSSVQKSQPRLIAAVSSVMASNARSSAKSEDLSMLHSELAKLRDYRMQAEINKHNEDLQSQGGGSPEALNDKFSREPLDPGWAKDKETLINNLVDESEYLSKIPHMTSECRSKQCRISVLSDDQFYLNKLSTSLDKIVADHEASFSSYMTVIDEKSHTTSVYFDRN